jgi:hypothetical protein
VTFDENMTFEEFIDKIGDYMNLDTLEGYMQARKLLRWAREKGKFTEPAQREKMGRIGGNITMYAGDLIVREYPKREGFQPDDSDVEDEDDLEDDADDPIIGIIVDPSKAERIEYVSS